MMRRSCRSSGAALLAGVLALCVLAHEAWAGCNPPSWEGRMLTGFTVKHLASGRSTTATFNDNPKTLVICEADPLVIRISATGPGGAVNPAYVGWTIEEQHNKDKTLVAEYPSSPPTVPPGVSENEGNVGATIGGNSCNLDVTLYPYYPAPSFRVFHVKAFCDDNKDCVYNASDAYYEDTKSTPEIIEIDVVILKVETVSVDATDDIGPTKINYRVLPSGASIPSVTFTAPGMTETRANVSGDLCFTYNQKDLVPGNNTIRLSYLSCQTDITANKQAVPKGPAEEIVIATYPENDDPPVLVNIPITHKIIAERYWRISYSGAPVVPGSRTLHVGSTDVKVEVPDTREISWVLEKHRYHDNDGNHCEQVMSLVTGATLPPTTDYRKYYDSSDDAFFKPGNGLTGIAQLDAMAFDDNGNIVQPVNIANEEVDQSME